MTPESLGRLFWDRVVPIRRADSAACQGRRGLARRVVAGAWRGGAGGRARPDRARPPAGRRGGAPLPDPGRSGSGRTSRSSRRAASRSRCTPHIRRRPSPTSSGTRRRARSSSRTSSSSGRRSRPPAEMPSLESVVLIARIRSGAGAATLVFACSTGRRSGRWAAGRIPPARSRRAWTAIKPGRRRDDRVHLGDHGLPEGRRADAREPPGRARHDRAGLGGARRRRPSPLPPARALVRPDGELPRDPPGPDHRLRREPRAASGEPAGGLAGLPLQRASRVREGVREDPLRGGGRAAGPPADLPLGPRRRAPRQPPRAGRAAAPGRPPRPEGARGPAGVREAPRGPRRPAPLLRVGGRAARGRRSRSSSTRPAS